MSICKFVTQFITLFARLSLYVNTLILDLHLQSPRSWVETRSRASKRLWRICQIGRPCLCCPMAARTRSPCALVVVEMSMRLYCGNSVKIACACHIRPLLINHRPPGDGSPVTASHIPFCRYQCPDAVQTSSRVTKRSSSQPSTGLDLLPFAPRAGHDLLRTILWRSRSTPNHRRASFQWPLRSVASRTGCSQGGPHTGLRIGRSLTAVC